MGNHLQFQAASTTTRHLNQDPVTVSRVYYGERALKAVSANQSITSRSIKSNKFRVQSSITCHCNYRVEKPTFQPPHERSTDTHHPPGSSLKGQLLPDSRVPLCRIRFKWIRSINHQRFMTLANGV